MRISDWSSDVCSSDLAILPGGIDILEARGRDAGLVEPDEAEDGVLHTLVEDAARQCDRADGMAQQQVRVAALFGFEVGVETILVEAAVAVERALEQLAHGRKASRGGEAEFGDPIAREGVAQREFGADRKSTRLNSSHSCASRMPSSA